MAGITEDIFHLSQEIGARPSGTEEEQQAALHIAEKLQNEAGFQTVIEDFNSVSNGDFPEVICFGITFLCALLSIFVSILALPLCIVSAIATALYALEVFDKPFLTKRFRNGVSQNVVAKYQPAGVPQKRRKIILVANYDSGKVAREHTGFTLNNMKIIKWVVFGGMVAVPVILLLRALVFVNASGPVAIVFNVITAIAAILCAFPLIGAFLHNRAEYTPAANNNAAGIAVMLDVANTVGNGRVSLDEMEDMAAEAGIEVEGEQAARAEGVVPEGAKVEYVANKTPRQGTHDSLREAKEAIAALTGQAIADTVPISDISGHLVTNSNYDPAVGDVRFMQEGNRPGLYVESEHPEISSAYQEDNVVPAENEQFVDDITSVVQPTPESIPAPVEPVVQLTPATEPVSKGIPSWARSAQQKARANRPEDRNVHVSRSRYADAPAARIAEETAPATMAPIASAGGTKTVFTANEAVESRQDAIYGNQVTPTPWDTPQQNQPLSGNPELAARLAALRNEISSSPVPHVSDEVKQAFNEMDEKKETTPVVEEQQLDESVDISVSQVNQIDSVPENQKPESEPVEFTEYVPDSIYATDQNDYDFIEEIPVDNQAHDRRKPGSNPWTDLRERLGKVGSEISDAAGEVSARFRRDAHEVEEITEEGVEEVFKDEAVAASVIATEIEDIEQAEPVKSNRGVSLRSNRSASHRRSKEEDIAQDNNEQDQLYNPEAEQTVEAIDVSAYMSEPVEEPEGVFEGFDAAYYAPIEDRFPIEENTSVSLEQSASTVSSESLEERASVSPIASPRFTANDSWNEVTSPLSMEDMQEALHNIPQQVEVAAPIKSERRSPISGLPSIDSNEEPRGVHHVINLPSIDLNEPSQTTSGQQRAPMADIATTPSILNSAVLPRIDLDEEPVDRFGLNLPPIDAEPVVERNLVSATSSFSTVGGTGAFAPVGDELLKGVAPEDVYVDDADDSVFEEGHTETGAFAGPEYVDLPKSRMGGLFSRFGRKKNEEPSLKDIIGADDDYDSRSVGEARGDWSSFRNNEEKWNGGAFNLGKLKEIGGNLTSSVKDKLPTHNPEPQSHANQDGFDSDTEPSYDPEPSYTSAPIDDQGNERIREINREMRKMNEFRHPDIDTEVWFVALGSELSCNSGMANFLETHADELQGAIIINLEALGAGKLTYLEEEGLYRASKPSSRIKRFLRDASNKSGVGFSTGALTSRTTAGAYAAKHGCQAFTLAGMKDGKTAYFGEARDTIDIIEEGKLEDASKFVFALLKSI